MHTYIRTPVYQSHYLSQHFDRKVSYKMECYQPSGSFKLRGMDTICRHYISEGKDQLIASSGGNAGYSLAYAGKLLGIRIEVVIPESTPIRMAEKIRSLGAKVTVHGKDWQEAHILATRLSEDLQIPYISPFDHPKLWEGHSTIIDECADVMDAPDKIVVAVGGGGLLLGIMGGMQRHGWRSKIIAAETVGAASFAAGLQAGRPIEIDSINTIATSLGARKVAKESIDLAKEFLISSYLVNDETALNACQTFSGEYNVLVEPACGAALSYGYDKSSISDPDEHTLIIACGGVCMDLDQLQCYQDKLSS